MNTKTKKVIAYMCMGSLLLQNILSITYASEIVQDTGIQQESFESSETESLGRDAREVFSQEARIGIISQEASIVEKEQEEEILPNVALERQKPDLKEKENQYSSHNIIVKYKKGKSVIGKISISNSLRRSSNGDANIDNLSNVDVGIVSFTEEGTDIQKKVQELSKLPYIEYAEVDYLLSSNTYGGVETNDPKSDELWHLKSIQADDAWKIYNDSSDKTLVSVNDTGIDYLHPDLLGNLKDLSSDCKSYTGGVISGGCPNNGRNFENGSYTLFSQDETYDISGHGTHVAGIVGAVGDNAIGTRGVTQNVEMIGVRAHTYDSLTEGFYISDTIKALDFAIENNVKVVNASYGGPTFSQASYDSIERARDSDVLLIAGAGNNNRNNDGTIHFYPSDYDLDNIISVGSVGPDDTLASYSNFGNISVDMVAPGGDITDWDTGEGGIVSTYPGKEIVFEENFDTGTGFTIDGINSDWYVYTAGQGIHTQSTYSYTGGVDSILTFDTPFSLSGATIGTLEGYISCDFGTGGVIDSDLGDGLDFYIYDQDDTTYNLVSSNFSSFIGGNNYSFTIPIDNPWLLKDNLQLVLNFYTDNDEDVGGGCWIDDLEITSHNKNTHSYKSLHGTSMATPVVTGVAAMVWSYNPNLNYLEVKDILMSSVDNLGLQSQIKTGGKVNAQNAIQETIARHGLTKTGLFEGQDFDTAFIALDGKDVTLSGSTLHITGTGNILHLENGSTVSGTGVIELETGSSITNNSGTLMSTSEDFAIVIKDELGNTLSQSGQVMYGEGIYLGYTGALSGSGMQIFIEDVYDGSLEQDTFIPIHSDFSGSLLYTVYKKGEMSEGFSNTIELQFLIGNTFPIDFIYSKEHIEVTLSQTGAEIGQGVGISLRAVGVDGNTMTSYTGAVSIDSISDSGAIFTGGLSSNTYTFGVSDNGEKVFPASVIFSKVGTADIVVSDINNGDFSGTGTIEIQAKTIPAGNATFGSGSATNHTGTTLSITSSEYPVNYTITGDILSTLTGVLNTSNSVNLELTSGDGTKEIQVELTDIDNNVGISDAEIILDQTQPDIQILSHLSGIQIAASSITLTGSISDTNNIDSLIISGNTASISSGEWSQIVTLEAGLNTITYIGKDVAGNTTTGNIQVIRVPRVSNIAHTENSFSAMNISFDTDIASKGEVVFGTNSGNLILSSTTGTGTSHALELTELQENTQYYYQVRGIYNSYTGGLSTLRQFTTSLQDTTPESFTFSPNTSVEPNTLVTSNAVTISGINSTTAVTINGGSYRVNGGTWTNSTGSINNGDTLEIQLTASPAFATTLIATVYVGGVSAEWSVSTKSQSSGGGGGGGSSRAVAPIVPVTPTCSDEQLLCQIVPKSEGVYKYYKKSGVSCDGGNFEKTCDKESLTESVETPEEESQVEVKSLDTRPKDTVPLSILSKSVVFQDTQFTTLFQKEANTAIQIDTSLASISYLGENIISLREDVRSIHTDWVKLLEEQDTQKDTKNMKQVILSLRKYKKDISEYQEKTEAIGVIKNYQLGDTQVSYIEYENTTITKLQNLLKKRFLTTDSSTELFEKTNRLLYVLNSIVTQTDLTTLEIQALQKEGRQLYKDISALSLNISQNGPLHSEKEVPREPVKKLVDTQILPERRSEKI